MLNLTLDRGAMTRLQAAPKIRVVEPYRLFLTSDMNSSAPEKNPALDQSPLKKIVIVGIE